MVAVVPIALCVPILKQQLKTRWLSFIRALIQPCLFSFRPMGAKPHCDKEDSPKKISKTAQVVSIFYRLPNEAKSKGKAVELIIWAFPERTEPPR